jgi:NADH-quinone oxidoreductase subunit C
MKQEIEKLKKEGARYVTSLAHLDLESEENIILNYLFDIKGEIKKLSISSKFPGNFESIKSMYPAAEWSEREIMEMYGITFTDYEDTEKGLLITAQTSIEPPLVNLERERILKQKYKRR